VIIPGGAVWRSRSSRARINQPFTGPDASPPPHAWIDQRETLGATLDLT
jgi:hypothetical protein